MLHCQDVLLAGPEEIHIPDALLPHINVVAKSSQPHLGPHRNGLLAMVLGSPDWKKTMSLLASKVAASHSDQN